MDTRLSSTFKLQSHEADEGHSRKLLHRAMYFLRAVEFWPTFDVQIDITLAIIWEKLQN